MLLAYPPAARSTEPPLGIARLAGFLNRNGVPTRCLDLCREGLDYLLTLEPDARDTWTRGALRRRSRNRALLGDIAAYATRDRYRRALLDLNRALKAASQAFGVEASLADYRDLHRLPDLAARHHLAFSHEDVGHTRCREPGPAEPPLCSGSKKRVMSPPQSGGSAGPRYRSNPRSHARRLDIQPGAVRSCAPEQRCVPDESERVEVPYGRLAPDVLRRLIEEFVTRDGTDYGAVELTLGAKVSRVMRQLEAGELAIVVDPEQDAIDIVVRRPA